MVAKKRNTLRGKVSARVNASASIFDNSQEEPKTSELAPDPKAFLHQFRETKKDKQLNKQSAFLSKIKQSTNDEFSGISKSSIRRRKRKMRDDLKPKMQDLLTSLEQEQDLKDITAQENVNGDNMEDEISVKPSVTRLINAQKEEPGSIKIRRNEPNIRTKKGSKLLAVKESERFHQVLTNPTFKQNTFAALRDVIKLQKK